MPRAQPRQPRAGLFQNRHVNSTLSLQDRIRVIDAYKTVPSYNILAKQFKCSVIEIRNIHRRGKQRVLKEYVKKRAKEYLGMKYIQSESDFLVATFLEKLLYEWFRRAQRTTATGPITNAMLLQRAEQAKRLLPMKNFKIDLDWILKFRQKHNITDLEMTMLMIGEGNEPVDLNMIQIAVYVLDQHPSIQKARDSSEVLLDLCESDVEFVAPDSKEEIRPKLELPDQNSSSSNDGSILTDEVDDAEVELPPIANDEEARRLLKPLEDYALIKENYRAIGLIEQLKQVLSTNIKEE